MRVRTLIPLLLTSVAALPAAAGEYSICLAAADSVNCIIEQAEFARQRNAEIDASIAAVARTRAFEQARNAEIAASIAAVNAVRTHQLEIEQNALATRVLAAANVERNRRFAAYQNRLATASVERVAAVRKWELAMSMTHCQTPRSRTPRCLAERTQKFAKRQNALATASIERVKAERERQFAAARNAEIERSVAAVARNRATTLAINTTHCTGIEVTPRCEAERNREMTLALTHCKSDADNSPRCIVQRDRDFRVARNNEIDRSIAAVARNRATELAINMTHCQGGKITPRCEAERDRDFRIARNTEINHSTTAVAHVSADYSRIETSTICAPYDCKTSARNAPSNASNSAPTALSAAEYAALTSHCVRAPQSPRCDAERIREFAAARNAEIERSLAAVARNRATELAINTTHCTGLEVTPRCEAERNREITLALTHCKSDADSTPRCAAERDHNFRNARNNEINHSIAAVAGARALARMQAVGALANGRNPALSAALSAYGSINAPLETGAIGSPELPMDPGPTPAQDLKLQHNSANEPCRAAGTPFAPLPFVNGIAIDGSMTPELDRLANVAQTCPGVRIEVHGYSDGTGSAFTNHTMAQARAQAIADYLIAAGVAPNRVAAIGRGSMDSVLPYSRNARSRRVEFVIKDPGMDAAARRVMWDLAELLDPTYIPAVAGLSP